MDTTDDGQVIKARELKTDFVIPKKKTDDQAPAVNMNSSILENVYPAPSTELGYEAYAQIYAAYAQAACPPTDLANLQKRSWTTANVTQPNPNLLRTLAGTYDPTLPGELLAMFQPLYCKLCTAQLSSNVMAKTHYSSKNHDKKVRKYLIEYSEKTGEPVHKRAMVPRAQKDEEYNPKYYHCDVCDLALTGKVHAESHYMGKNHNKALMGKKAPAGKGYYNTEGKWVRVVETKTEQIGDGFGASFQKKEPENPAKPRTYSLRCAVCDITVTSTPQLEMHLQGQKHMKKLKSIANGIVTAGPENVTGHVPHIDVPPTNPDDLLSAYRTPSGQYYCKTCNISLNSELQFTQHLNSRKHMKKNSKE